MLSSDKFFKILWQSFFVFFVSDLFRFVRGSTVSMYTCIQMNKKVQYQVTSTLTCNTGNIHTDMPANTLHCQVTVTLTCHNDNTQRCANRHTLSIFREHSHWHVTLLTSAMTCQLTISTIK